MMRVLSIVMLIALVSCIQKSNRNKNAEKKYKSVMNEVSGKTLVLPEGLRFSYLNKGDSCSIKAMPKKIYSYVDASCGSCIANIDGWDQFLDEYCHLEVSVVIVCISDDNFALFEYLIEQKRAIMNKNIIFLYDQQKKWLTSNPFMIKYDQLRVVLTDSDDRILLLGNPINNKKLMESYIGMIKGGA